jgi:hypothetical protein
MKVLMIDPPGGWQYGFPKPVHEEFHTLGEDFDLGRWLVEQGYPEKDLELALRYGRYWEQEIDDGIEK